MTEMNPTEETIPQDAPQDTLLDTSAPTPDTPTVNTSMDDAVTQEALRTGWTPKEEFKGDPSRWRPASEWVERGREFIPFIKAQNRTLQEEIEAAKKELETTRQTMDKMVEIQSKYSQDQYNDRVSRLEAQRREAVESGDVQLYDRLTQEVSKITPPETIDPAPKPQATPEIHPAIKRMIDSDWYKNPSIRDYANYVGEKLASEKHPAAAIGNEELFAQEVESRLRETFPASFENPNRNTPTLDDSMTSGGAPMSTNDKNTWNDLPKAAQAQYRKIEQDLSRQGVKFTKEQYLNDYFG